MKTVFTCLAFKSDIVIFKTICEVYYKCIIHWRHDNITLDVNIIIQRVDLFYNVWLFEIPVRWSDKQET